MTLPTTDPAGRILALLDKAEPRIQKAFLEAIKKARGTLSLKEIEALIEDGQVEEALAVVIAASTGKVAAEYAAAYTMAGSEGAKFLEDALEVVVSFDQVNVRAVEHMRNERLRLITEFTSEQRRATRRALLDGIERGLNPRDQARNFRNSIGLTSRQQAAVQNYRRLLEDGSTQALSRQLRDRRFDRTVQSAIKAGRPLSKEQIDLMVERYGERYVKYRSEVIGRTEALRAVNSGTHEAYRQAIGQGLIDEDQLQRKWVDAHDSRVRHSHRRLNGLVRGVNETFPAEGGPLRFPGDPNGPASETVQCRCALSTRIGAPA